MIANIDIILTSKYVVSVLLLMGVMCTPVWIARQNKKSGIDMVVVRLGAWILGWTGIGWLVSLYWAAKK